jgi:ferredoxin
MDKLMKTTIERLIREGLVDAFWAYRSFRDCHFPWLFTQEDLHHLEPWRQTDVRFPIVKLLLASARENPEKTYGILVRGCEERGIEELFKWNQLKRERVVILGQACSKSLAAKCECRKPFPDRLQYGEAVAPVMESKKLRELEQMTMESLHEWWLAHLNRCIRCFGCRDVCPVCFCIECSLEHTDLIPGTILPPDASFHLLRAIHMGGRCIDCGLCEEICPAHIPLRSLHKKVNELVRETFGYTPGDGNKSPFTLLGDVSELPSLSRRT